MDQQKITILYCRLSNEDAFDDESNSIANQRSILTRFAADHGFTNTRILVKDHWILDEGCYANSQAHIRLDDCWNRPVLDCSNSRGRPSANG